MNNYWRITIGIILVIAIFSFDQTSKAFVRENLAQLEGIIILEDKLLFQQLENSGGTYSWGTQLPRFWKVLILQVAPSISLLAFSLFIIIRNKEHIDLGIGAALLVGGASGNLYDRVLRGSVTDFIYFDFEIVGSGIFNFADAFIVLGCFFILIHAFRHLVADIKENISTLISRA